MRVKTRKLSGHKADRDLLLSLRETADGYSGFVAQLNPDWRVVACRDRVQSILQRRGSPEKPRKDDWRGRSYCRTREALIRCTREHAGPIDPAAVAILASLPERFETPEIEVTA